MSVALATGCICGKDVRHEGTCIFCGHGRATSVITDLAYALLAASPPDARVVPLRRAPSHQFDEDACVTAYRAWEREHGRAPHSTDWTKPRERGEHRPSYAQVRALFGGWPAFRKYIAQVPREQVAA